MMRPFLVLMYTLMAADGRLVHKRRWENASVPLEASLQPVLVNWGGSRGSGHHQRLEVVRGLESWQRTLTSRQERDGVSLLESEVLWIG